MKPFIGLFLTSYLLICSIVSCRKDDVTAVDFGYNYFPNDIGKFVTYNVDSFYHNSFTKHIDTFKFQLKEKIQSIYPDNQNRPTIRLERYVKNFNAHIPYSLLPWVLVNVRTENRTVTTAEKVEDNVRYIKLVFPAKKYKSWDGNIQNINGKLTYSYLFVDLSRSFGGIRLDSVLQVNQQDETNLVAKRYYIENYARNVGLVYKQIIDVSSQPNPSLTPTQLGAFYALPILERITSGTQCTYTITSYGTE